MLRCKVSANVVRTRRFRVSIRGRSVGAMGTWGTGIFADDTAADIREDWRESILDGLTPAEASARILERYADEVDDPDQGPVVWLALAAAQFQTGRLLPDVRDNALAIIESGADVRRFAAQDPALGRQRGKALDALAAKLLGPPRSPTRMVRSKPFLSPLEIGDVVLVLGKDGSNQALLVVVGIASSYPPGSTMPVLATLLWADEALPDTSTMARLPLLLDDSRRVYDRQNRPVLSLHAVMSPPTGTLAMPGSVEIIARGVRRLDIPDQTIWEERDGPILHQTSWAILSAWIGGADYGSSYRHQVELTSEVAAGKHWLSLSRFRRGR